ncbi:hypothetical protein RHGRI_012897 [Rhododendron griersonianum]|uniref:Uncharacterized protein n=1 Tax=Rhododendron griersonianum TaxID=479676 RepID=A0AAV6K3U7_9ERIC|nr:hypothetical protein RHGRI_012897 [Rhododendron griersonianum]
MTQIPVGVEHIGIPGSESAQNIRDLMVEVYWKQDTDGNLCISGHSVEIPIPNDVDCTLPSTLPKESPCLGIVIEMPLTSMKQLQLMEKGILGSVGKPNSKKSST